MYVTEMIILIKMIIMQVFICDPEFCPGSEYTLVVQFEANPLPTQVVHGQHGRDEHVDNEHGQWS